MMLKKYNCTNCIHTFLEPPKRPKSRPALTNSWPNIEGHNEFTRTLYLKKYLQVYINNWIRKIWKIILEYIGRIAYFWKCVYILARELYFVWSFDWSVFFIAWWYHSLNRIDVNIKKETAFFFSISTCTRRFPT